jgi:hypothetical protein
MASNLGPPNRNTFKYFYLWAEYSFCAWWGPINLKANRMHGFFTEKPP